MQRERQMLVSVCAQTRRERDREIEKERRSARETWQPIQNDLLCAMLQKTGVSLKMQKCK